MNATPSILDQLETPSTILTVEERLKRVENVVQMFLGYMRGKRSMQEMEDLLSMASKLGGELMWNGTDFPPLNAKTPSLIIDDTIPEPIPPPYDTTPLEEEPDWSEIPFVE